jgi:cytochrome oxidase Cu insertion factor (SCO1/SenC/PrrC family)
MATSSHHDAGYNAEAGGGFGHTDAIYLIDPEGRERVFMRSTADPEDVAHNFVALLK